MLVFPAKYHLFKENTGIYVWKALSKKPPTTKEGHDTSLLNSGCVFVLSLF